MIVYTNKITPRLQYVTDFIGKKICGESFQLTTDRLYFSNHKDPKINYSSDRICNDELLIINHSLLFEDSIREQNISCFEINNFKAFFKTSGDYPFDILAATFYLMSRYEEYLPHKKDMYGRYTHENSLASKEGFLNLPLVNIWIEDFKEVLKTKYSTLNFQLSTFNFQPTYDIDEAFAFKNKEPLKIMGGFVKSVVGRQWSVVNERWKTMRGKSRDPYDAYEWMDKLHEKYMLKPYYFFHVAEKKGKYDKNISPANKAMQELVQHHYYRYPVGVHPSWRSGDEPGLLKQELQIIEKITGGKILSSRQHYIRFSLPETFRRLIDAGIQFDFSMGYGSINGFRASVASPFYWYDLEKEEQTQLQLLPFCFMDANSYYEQKSSAQQALEELKHYCRIIKSVNGLMITIWHNNFLGTDRTFTGWKEMYEQFISEIITQLQP